MSVMELQSSELLERFQSGARLQVDALAMRRSDLASLVVKLLMYLV